jgi:RNA polymerase sigma-70 factor (ECF subfamily)
MAGHESERGADTRSARSLSTLVENHHVFLRFLERLVGDRATAEDILQEAFAHGFDKLDELHEEESAAAWFYRVLRNKVIDRSRRAGSASRMLESYAAETKDHVEPEVETRRTICACVGNLADNLKPEYSEALRRVEVDGLAVKAYAAEVGISSGNAAVRVFRARAALRKQVVRCCGTCATDDRVDCTCGSGVGCSPKSG